MSLPSRCGYPDASTTGVPASTTLSTAGCINASTPGQVVQNISLTTGCDINVTAPDVVIRNVRMSLSSVDGWAIIIRPGASATIDHVTISGHDKLTGSVEYAILSQSASRVTITNSDLSRCADCIQGENLTVSGNYIHDLANPPGAHVDGIQCNSSCGLTVTGNTILNEYGQTSAIALFADFGTPRNSTINNNLLAGGGYTVYAGGPNSTGITITGNRFARLYFATSGQYGTHTQNTNTTTWTNNIWDDTRTQVTPR